MVLDPRKRQKKLERKKAKEKKRAIAERKSLDPVVRFERAAVAPVLDVVAHDALWRDGIGNLLLSRKLANGGVAFSSFLLDVYCLGVKDVYYGVTSRSDYDWRILTNLSQVGKIRRVSPEFGRKLVEGAADYARSLGFAPHAGYEVASLIFGDIDSAICKEEFIFGKDGKPYYFAGPRDSQVRIDRVLSILNSRFGPGGYHYTVPVTSGLSLVGLPEDDDDGDEPEFDEDYLQ